MKRSGRTLSVVLTLVGGSASAQFVDAPSDPAPDLETVYYDWVRDDGVLAGGRTELVIDRGVYPTPGVAGVQLIGTFAESDALPNRVDVVFVGDGYTAGELGLYAVQADSFADEFFSYEPFTSYRPLFQVHRVDVVSNESGVDNDPSRGINRDTALDMAYWCNNTERLLCVNVGKAYSYAATAPYLDVVVAIANSSKYGGAGYPSSDLATAAAGNGAAVDIVIHELGHALGDLADEYTYGGPTNYTGPEPSAPNASVYDSTTMHSLQRKWYRWIGTSMSGFDNPVSTYEGCNYSVNGIYRPSNNSMMRALNRPFNLPSAEALIVQIYRLVDVIDAHAPQSPAPPADSSLWVDPVDPLTGTIEIGWTLNGAPVGDGSATLDLAPLGARAGDVVRATVVDATPWVRNETDRANHMTHTVQWTLGQVACPADLTGEGDVNVNDFFEFLSLYQAGDVRADFVPGGGINTIDFFAFLAAYQQGC